MNDNRHQKYLDIIQELLSCPNGEAVEILNANRELIDAGLVCTIRHEAEVLGKNGNRKSADFLIDLACQLAELLGTSENVVVDDSFPSDVQEEYFNFLLKVLQTTADSNGDSHAVYPLLQRNLDKLDDLLAGILQAWCSEILINVKSEEASYIAAALFHFSNLILQFPLGNELSNLEIAITGYENALEVYTRRDYYLEWARTQYNLGIAYRSRIKKDKEENIELAIACFNKASEVYTQQDFPLDWASTQYNLGVAYIRRQKEDEEENIELAIACFNKALEGYTRHDYSLEWADTQYNLGVAYIRRQKKDKGENIELAIACFNKASEVYTQQDFPLDWASTQYNLGVAYKSRIKKDKEENIELAIACFNKALEIYTQQDFPLDWASTQYNLGVAYKSRIKKDKEENIELAIACFNKALEIYRQQNFPLFWANAQYTLGIAYRNRIKKDKEENIELAMACFKNALEVYTRSDYPDDWANTQNNLGVVYFERIKENQEENIESAITCFNKALEVHTRSDYPDAWASIQYNLGNNYKKRIKGNKWNNIESAIIYYEKALEVHTQQDYPDAWANTQNNLGATYRERQKEDKAENIESAITCFKNALEVRTRRDFSLEWARIQNSLGSAYCERIKGDKEENIELGITCFNKALEVHTRSDYPVDWAGTLSDLGNAYRERIKENIEENIESAITCFKNALEVRTRNDYPDDWALTQSGLGNAYSERVKGNREENIELAITCYEKALEVHTQQDNPLIWASTQTNLGVAFCKRIKGNKEENIELAITYFNKALEVRSQQDTPLDWALTQANFGIAYSERIEGDREKNIELAISCFNKALRVTTPETFPQHCLAVRRNLGNLFFSQENWQKAIESYQIAVEIVDDTRLLSIDENRKQEIIAENIIVFANIIKCYVQIEKYEKAIEYVERNKTRNLVELIAIRDLYPQGKIPPEKLTELDILRQKILVEQKRLAYSIQTKTFETRADFKQDSELLQTPPPILADLTNYNRLRQQLDRLIEDEIRPIDPKFSLTQKVKSIPFNDIKSLINEHTAILEWYLTKETIFTFLVTHYHPKPQVWQFSTDKQTNLENWMEEYLQKYFTDQFQWRASLESVLQKLADILHLEEIISFIPKECEQLILIPHRFLHVLPLHALPVKNQNSNNQNFISECLIDLFPRGLRYVPSCQLLELVQSKKHPDFHKLLAIQNPTEDLIYSDLEVETIQNLFSDAEVLLRQAASEASLKKHQNLPLANCIHFACHGEFNSVSPLESALVLSKDEANTEDSYLTLAEIFELSFQQCRLVTLSACETGLTDFNSLSDEYIGLSNGFLFAGSPSIVSSLWTVSDLSTAFLMVKFYENLPQSPQAGEVAMSLQKAQKWLRDLTYQEFDRELTKPKYQKALAQLQQKFSPADFFELEDAIETERNKMKKFELDDKPFANPFYWAAFIATGV